MKCVICNGDFSPENCFVSESGGVICEECLSQHSQTFDEVSQRAILRREDPAMAEALQGELERERNTIELIASENHTSRAVLAAQGSVATNKYAEGLPGARYYGGCEFVDKIEVLARERAMELFEAEHANVQPHSGSQANTAVYLAALKPGDTVLGLSLAHGGHLTHGSKANISGKVYNFVSYGVDPETERIDMEQVRALALEHRPKMIVTGASAYPRLIDFDAFSEIAREVGALLMVDIAHIAGLVAGRVHPSPIKVADFVTGTTHKSLRGPRSGFILCKKEWAEKIDKAVFPGIQGGPMMHEIAAKGVAFGEALHPTYRQYSQGVVENAKVLAEVLASRGLRIVSGGTDNHLMLVDLRAKGITGKTAEELLGSVGLVINKNAIPFDPEPPTITSGIRLGTPAATTRGMGTAEMTEIGSAIADILDAPGDASVAGRVSAQVQALCDKFPLYPSLKY